jgi:hypothetical protein
MGRKKADFHVKCEGDVERVCGVFASWLRSDDINFDKIYRICVPNEQWAHIFVDIYADYIENENLEEEAKLHIINIVFEVENITVTPEEFEKLSDMSDEDLLDALDDLMDNTDDDDDEDNDDDDEL